MGTDPRTSGVDPNQHVHECPNLYLGGSELLVTGTAVQPLLTMVTPACRLAEQLQLDCQVRTRNVPQNAAFMGDRRSR